MLLEKNIQQTTCDEYVTELPSTMIGLVIADDSVLVYRIKWKVV